MWVGNNNTLRDISCRDRYMYIHIHIILHINLLLLYSRAIKSRKIKEKKNELFYGTVAYDSIKISIGTLTLWPI